MPPLAVACTSLLSTGNTLATPSSDDDAPDFRSFGGLNVCNLQLVKHTPATTEVQPNMRSPGRPVLTALQSVQNLKYTLCLNCCSSQCGKQMGTQACGQRTCTKINAWNKRREDQLTRVPASGSANRSHLLEACIRNGVINKDKAVTPAAQRALGYRCSFNNFVVSTQTNGNKLHPRSLAVITDLVKGFWSQAKDNREQTGWDRGSPMSSM